MLTGAQVAEFQENGYVNGGLVLGDVEVDELRDELARVIDEKDRADVSQPVLLRISSKSLENAAVTSSSPIISSAMLAFITSVWA